MFKIGQVLKGLQRNLAMSIASLILIFFTMLVLGFMIILSLNTSTGSDEIVSQLKVHVYVEKDASEADVDTLNKELTSNPNVSEVSYSTKEEQMDLILSKFNEEDAEKIKEYFSGDKNPLNDVFYVTPRDNVDLSTLTEQLKVLNNVEDADYGSNSGADSLLAGMRMIKVISFVVVVILSLITIFLIVNTIKLTIDSRRKEIEIMRLVGATKTYITVPFTLEGLILGTVGSLLAFAVTVLVYNYIYGMRAQFLNIQLISPGSVIGILGVAQVLFGLVLGIIASLFAIRKYLKV